MDRLVGYELSPVLWRKVKPNLSAGRVQSVTVKLIVQREQEIINHKPIETYKVTATFLSKEKTFKAELTSNLGSKEEAESFLNSLIDKTFVSKI